MFSHSVLPELAYQREEQLAARLRLPRPEPSPPATTRRRGKRGRARGAAGLRTLLTRS